MKIRRFARIQTYRVFHDYAWPPELPPFARFNLIYGWNGSGKTTLTSILQCVQDKTAPIVGNVELDIDGRIIPGKELPRTVLPAVRVFDQNFVAANLSKAGGTISPIYVFGEDSVQKQQRVEALRRELPERNQASVAKSTERSAAERSLDDLRIAQATLIRELLRAPGQGTYNNYDKGDFKREVEKVTKESAKLNALSEQEKETYKAVKNAAPKQHLDRITIVAPDIAALESTAYQLIAKSVVSTILAELTTDAQTAAWIQEGISLHKGSNASALCKFCTRPLPQNRLQHLEGHFNDEFTRLQSDIQALMDTMTISIADLKTTVFRDTTAIYENLIPSYEQAKQIATNTITEAVSHLNGIISALKAKHTNPLERISLASYVEPTEHDLMAMLASVIREVNAIIEKHNRQTENFATEVVNARRKLELAIVADAFPEYEKRRNAVTVATDAHSKAQIAEATLVNEIETLSREIAGHRRPFEELNAELARYLGRSELRLEFKDPGYAITRGGYPADNLSEGEKTAITFLYFLKSLTDASFDISNSVVAIDDPVSSLDANSLFSAFAFLKERCKKAGQLIILTHNFGLFRQVRGWYHQRIRYKEKEEAAELVQFYSLRAFQKGGHRNAAIQSLDPLLRDYESEYHYLFKLVYEESNKAVDGEDLQRYYGMPNVGRRLLESFLAFRLPLQCGELGQQMALVQFDEVRKGRILRFLQTFSHRDYVADSDHDLSILAETKQVLMDLLALIEEVDGPHYAEMMRLIGGA